MSEKKAIKKTTSKTHVKKPHHHPSHAPHLTALKKIQGQIGGIHQMIEDGRYCVDILIQCRAAMAAMRGVESKIFQKHLSHCVEDAFMSKDSEGVRKKIEELTALLSKRTSL